MSLYHSCTNLMDFYSTSAATIITIILTFVYYWSKNRDILPGPKGIPYLGLYPFLTNQNVLRKMEKYKKKYGYMFSFTYAGRSFISLNSFEAMRELHLQNSDYFTERYRCSNIINKMIGNGLVFLNGESYRILKQFFIHKFNDYEQKIFWSNFDDWMAAPVDLLICSLEERRNAERNTVDYFTRHYTIILNEILFGKNGASQEDMQKMVEAFRAVFEGYSTVNSLLSGPLEMLLLKTDQRSRKILQNFQAIKTIILYRAKRIESCLNEDEPRCIIEEYFKERNRRRRKNDPSWKFFSDETLVESLFQFVGHGALSFGTLIADAINALATHMDEQEKVFTEITQEIGLGRQPLRVDRLYLPYTNAFINECIRTSKFMLFMPSLECTKEFFVSGYRIPKGSVTLLNFHLAHNDPELFEDPHLFNPTRYFFRENKGRLPSLFGMGKRMCTGESFVMLQTFVCLATIVRNFSFHYSNLLDETNLDGSKRQLTIIPRTGHLYNNLSKNLTKNYAKACILQ